MTPRQDTKPLVYETAKRWVDRCLRHDGSLFTDGAAIWSLPLLEELHELFVEHPDTSKDPFEVKLSRQLGGTRDPAIQLAAELLFVHFLPASRIGGGRKRELINHVLGWMSSPVPLDGDDSAALDEGVMYMGVAFNTGRNHGFGFLLDFAMAWKGLSDDTKSALLVDPWAFKEFVWGLPIFSAYAQREGVLHLVHPETFESIAYGQHKLDIAAAFEDRVQEPTDDVDRKLISIRNSLELETGHPINFYAEGIVERWQPEKPDGAAPQSGPPLPVVRQAWLVRGTTQSGDSLVPQWIDESFVSIGWQEIGPVEPGTTRAEIRDRLAEWAPDDTANRRGLYAGMIDKFVNKLDVGDLIVAPHSSDIYVGVITSGSTFLSLRPEEPGQLARRREVDWLNATQPANRQDVSEGLYSKMRTLLTLTDVSIFAEELAVIGGISGEVAVPLIAPTLATLPLADQSLEKATLLPHAWLQEALDLLERKRQVVLYGPPGTGKTYVALRIGDHIVAAGGNYRLVQFHPSYTYEDFFEGFRPRATDTGAGVSFELVAGPLREIAEAALEDPSHPYLLIIDEINRANIAKVFGELYFLLEYRDSAVSLLYSPETEFILPKNLYIIGTMNTADRSIALIDAAMRRRFYFLRFSPDVEPIASLLPAWLSDRRISMEPAHLLKALNTELSDPDYSIGPSYLMDERILEDSELERVWTHAILPLLEEHYFGGGVDVQARFGLDVIRRAVPSTSGDETAEADDA